MIYPDLQDNIDRLQQFEISEERKQTLAPLIEYIQEKVTKKEPVNLNYICTHNSRRSQLSQVWSKLASTIFKIDSESYSGGVEVTAFNERAIYSLTRFGFQVSVHGIDNPKYTIRFSDLYDPIVSFSKLYDDNANPKESFAAIMTCSDADDNCPFIPGTEKRIALTYEDPKAFDDTEHESEKYDERSDQIGSELLYVFSKIV